MAEAYRAVLAVVAGQGSPPWGEVTRSVLPAAFRACGLDWGEAEHVRSGRGLLVVLPAAGAGRLAQGLTAALATLPGPVRLGLGLAVGMCHSDGKGWYGDAVTTARALAEVAGPGDVHLAVSEAVAELAPAAELDRAPAPAAELDLAQVIDAVAAPVAEFAADLPVLLSADVAPSDVLAWMYDALGVDSPRLLDDRHGRHLLAGLVGCYHRRGTARGLAELIELRYGVRAEIADPGRTTWSAEPETPVRQAPAPVTVLLDTDEPLDGLDEMIRSALPVGVGYRVSRRGRRVAGPVQ